ncbi:MAG: hypothetical protein AAFQ21_05845 [Pseudomonadota bacterium]
MELPARLRPHVVQGLRPHAQATPDFPFGLGETGVHEVCEVSFGDMPALTGFALAAARPRPGPLAWISQRRLSLNHGILLASGLPQLRRSVPSILSVHTSKPMDALWAVEEAVRSGAIACVIAEVEAIDFTASRRLTLASQRHGVPIILLLPYTCEGATAASVRWRVAPRPSSANPYDPRAPGHTRWHATLERSRAAPQLAGRTFLLDVNDETLSLSMVPGLAPHAPAPGAPRPADEPKHIPALRRRA